MLTSHKFTQYQLSKEIKHLGSYVNFNHLRDRQNTWLYSE